MPICGKCKGIASLLELQGACIAGVATICGERKDDPKEVATWVPNKASRGGCWLLPLHPCNALDISRTLHLNNSANQFKSCCCPSKTDCMVCASLSN
jgi:hypothetical protein